MEVAGLNQQTLFEKVSLTRSLSRLAHQITALYILQHRAFQKHREIPVENLKPGVLTEWKGFQCLESGSGT